MIAVIGGSGFIGTVLCRKLASAGLEFMVLDLNVSLSFPTRTRIVDVRNYELLKQALFDASMIVNLAAVHQDNVVPRSLYYSTNVIGARNVCEAARELKIHRIIFTSSVAVYGHQVALVTEDTDPNPENDYGKSKLEAEGIYSAWQSSEPIKNILIVLRPCAVFGLGNRGNIYRMMQAVVRGNFVMVGEGKNTKSIVDVQNLATVLMSCLERDCNLVANVTDPEALTIIQLCQFIAAARGQRNKRFFKVPQIVGIFLAVLIDIITINTRFVYFNRVRRFCSSSEVLSNHYLATPQWIPLRDGLRRTIDDEFGPLR